MILSNKGTGFRSNLKILWSPDSRREKEEGSMANKNFKSGKEAKIFG